MDAKWTDAVGRDDRRTQVLAEYSRLAPDYDRRWSFYIEATTEATLARMAHPHPEQILDVGCGTGVLLENLAARYPDASLAGVDPVADMLTIARRRVPKETDLREGWAEQLPFADRTFDVVVSCNMFHYVQDPRAALREMGRVLRPGGELVITDWCDDYLACRLCGWWLRVFGSTPVRVYRRRECLRLLEETGYPQASIDVYRISWLWGMMTARVTL